MAERAVLPLRRRLAGVLGLGLVAPVCAEYLQAYLPDTGDVLMMIGGLLILGPLYGGAALLVREAALRTGRGWPGVLLLAAAFGVLMPTMVDQSLWLEHNPDISYWEELREGTLLAPLGLAAYPAVTWTLGHVLFSVGAPMALLDALAPRLRGHRLLGRWGLVVTATLALTAALLIRYDPEHAAARPSGLQQGLSVLVALGLAISALSPLGRPLPPSGAHGARWRPPRVAVGGFLLALALDLAPPTWLGLAGYLLVLVLAAVVVVHGSRTPQWGLPHVTALAVGGVLERVLLGLVAPLPVGVSVLEKTVQGLVLLALVVAVAVLAWRRGGTGVGSFQSYQRVPGTAGSLQRRGR